MDYIEKLFKQFPFVYRINEEYYAFGTGICAKLDESSVLLKSRFNRYIASLTVDILDSEAWEIFRKVMSEANWKKDNLGYQGNEKKEFDKLGFNDLEIKELESQIQSYIDFYKKHNLKEYIGGKIL